MEKDDIKLIRSILSGDDSAFSDLVQKYQKSVHALAWRKIGDFQVAEEITQDAFLKAYKKLAMLKNPNQFAGWLYVIASNLCRDWQRRKKPTMQSLEATNTKTLEKTAYERYVASEREKAATEHRRELVKNLLEKLPESERTVVTLHYLGEMTSEAISKFLGVSVNTIKSRLRRARKRLKEEEPMIRETLGSVQLPADLTENIMEQIADIKPTPASSGRPLIPWAALGSAAVLVILLLGASSQYLTHFQKPYSLEAQSETAIEIVDASFILDVQSKTDTRRRVGSVVLANKNGGVAQQVSDAALEAENEGDSSKVSALTDKWTQATGPEGGNVHEIFLTSAGKLFSVSPTGIYRMTEDATGWVQINNTVPTQDYLEMPMAEWEDTLYIVSTRKIFASIDGGVNWHSVGSRPRGTAIELLITDEAFYLVMDDEIFKSTDAGKQWQLFNNGLEDREITAATAIGNTVFVGTNRGIYRLSSDSWDQLSVGTFRTINSLVVSGNNLYMGMSPDETELTSSELKTKLVREMMRNENSNQWEIFCSDDLGDSWIKITPQNRSFVDSAPGGIKVLAVGETLLAMGTNTYRSENGGLTWANLGDISDSYISADSPAVGVNENTFYKEGLYEIQRSTDGGESWYPFMKGMAGTKIQDLIGYKHNLYAYNGKNLIYSTSGGESWTNVHVDYDKNLPEPWQEVFSKLNSIFYPRLTVAGDSLYGIAFDGIGKITVYRLSINGDLFVPIKGLPPIEGEDRSLKWLKQLEEGEAVTSSETDEIFGALGYFLRSISLVNSFREIGGLAVSDDTFYVVYKQKLLKWKYGYSKWIDTGLDVGERSRYEQVSLAASAETVYVGRKDGHLFQSLDDGSGWKDVTPNLPLQFDGFKEIVFAGSTVYVATDKGVLTSESGEYWDVLTDSSGSNIVIVSLAVDRNIVYGGSNAGIYRLDDLGEWEQISPEVPDRVRKLVIHNDKFYIVTDNRGMFHIPLEKAK